MNRERLQKLAEHLESGKLAHKKFDIKYYNVGDETGPFPLKGQCGTVGCALGECPAVWPELWRWTTNGVILTGSVESFSGDEYDGLSAGAEFFEIPFSQSRSLFMPSGYLHEEVTALDVAKKIRGLLASN